MSRHRARRPWTQTALFIVAVLVLIAGWVATRPHVTQLAYRFPDVPEWQNASFPLIVEGAPPGPFIVEFAMDMPRVHPTVLYFSPDDCINRLIVNGNLVTDRGIPFCNFRVGRAVDLRGYVQPGNNQFIVEMRNIGWPAGLDIGVAMQDPLHFLFVLWCVVVAYGLLGGARVRRLIGVASKREWMTAKEKRQCIHFLYGAILVFAAVALIRGIDGLLARMFYELSDPYTADLGLYVAVGRGILNGLTPYADLFENKPPGMFLLSALSLRLFESTRLLHIIQAAILVGFPYALFLWHLLRSPWGFRDFRSVRTWFLLSNTIFFGIGIGLYTMLRSGEAQIESYGAFAAFGYLLIITSTGRVFGRAKYLAASLCMLAAIGFKEPFVLSLLAGALILTQGDLIALRDRFAKPLLIAAGLGLMAMIVLGYLGPYLTVYLSEMFGHHLPQSGSPFLRALHWHRLWKDVRDFAPGFVWSLPVMAGYSLWVRWRQNRSVEHMAPAVGALLFAVALTTFAVAMTNVYFNHHFVFAVPLYAALFLRFMQDIAQDRSRTGMGILAATTTLLAWAMYSPATMNYAHLLERFEREPVAAKTAAAAIDGILEACGKERYLFLGGNGPQPYAYTTHSPLGPLFMQYGYSLSPDRAYFREAFLRSLDDADLVVQHSFALADLHDEVTVYLNEEFTKEPWNCAKIYTQELRGYTFYYRTALSEPQ